MGGGWGGGWGGGRTVLADDVKVDACCEGDYAGGTWGKEGGGGVDGEEAC